MIDVPRIVRNKALALGASSWLDELPALVAALEDEWSIAVGRAYRDATEAFVAEATLADGTPAVLKLLVGSADAARHEIDRAAPRGRRRLRPAAARRRGPRGAAARTARRSLFELGLPLEERHEILCATAAAVWRPAPDCGLPTGADEGAPADRVHRADLGAARPPVLRARRRPTRSRARSAGSPPTTTSAPCSSTATCTSGTRSRPATASSSSTPTACWPRPSTTWGS